MHRPFFPLQRSPESLYQVWDWLDSVWLIILAIAALLLYTIGLDQPPLLATSEQDFHQVAQQYWQLHSQTNSSLQAVLGLSFEQPTLLHRITAFLYSLNGDASVGLTRLPSAGLAACAVPLLYLLGRELFLQRPAALLAASFYLTQWAVLQQGRLANLGSIPVCTSLGAVYFLLRSRRDLRWTIGLGVTLGLQCIADSLWAIALAAIVILFAGWDTPRLLTAKHFWWGTGLGISAIALGIMIQMEWNQVPFWLPQPWLSIVHPFKQFPLDAPGLALLSTFPWLPSLPWLIFWPVSLFHAYRYHNFSWGRLSLLWGGITLILLASGHHAIAQLYLVCAIVSGSFFAQFWQGETFSGLPHWEQEPYPISLTWGMAILTLASWANLTFWLLNFSTEMSFAYHAVNLCFALTTTLCILLMAQNNMQWLPLLIWGTYCSLFLLLQTPSWI